jgi:excinuclease UvrABC ATPase subunit
VSPTHGPGIDIVGADANNLAGVDVTFARHALTAIVGVSGSGKSSLVEETLATEAAARMRRFLDIDLGTLGEGEVRAFVGVLPPTLFVGQQAFRASSRTTIATSTGLLRVLRRLFLRAAHPVAADVGADVPAPSPEVFARWLTRHAEGKAIVWAVPVRHAETDGVAAVRRLLEAGLTDAVVRSETDRGARQETGHPVALARFRPLRADVHHTIEARVGEVRIGKATPAALTELLEKAWRAANGAVLIELPDVTRAELKGPFGYRLDTASHRVHPDSPAVYAPPSTHLLTFNAPEHEASGACPVCRGLGRTAVVDEVALVTHPERAMHDGAFALWTPKNYRYVNIQHETIEGLRDRHGFDPSRPWRDLSAAARAMILDGSPVPVEDRDLHTRRKVSAPRPFLGFRRAILDRSTNGGRHAVPLAALVRQGPCYVCGGTRWSTQARALRVCGWSIDGLLALPLSELADETARGRLATEAPPLVQNLVANLHRMAASFLSVGLGHLTGDRGMLDVSDGEARRSRLAGVLNSRLADLLLVLDEPARGLHELDLDSLGDALRRATERHTVVISEHRQRLVARADRVVELGPGAGAAGRARDVATARSNRRARGGRTAPLVALPACAAAGEAPMAARSRARASTTSRTPRWRSRWARCPASQECLARGSRASCAACLCPPLRQRCRRSASTSTTSARARVRGEASRDSTP